MLFKIAFIFRDGGFKYCIVSTDDFPDAEDVYFLKNKSDAVRATEKLLADVAPYGTNKYMKSDGDGEFI